MCLVISNLLEQFIYEGNNILKTFPVPQLLGFLIVFLVFFCSGGVLVGTKRTEKLTVLRERERERECVCLYIYAGKGQGGWKQWEDFKQLGNLTKKDSKKIRCCAQPHRLGCPDCHSSLQHSHLTHEGSRSWTMVILSLCTMLNTKTQAVTFCTSTISPAIACWISWMTNLPSVSMEQPHLSLKQQKIQGFS